MCVCARAQILMHGQKQASLISTLSEGQGVQELDSKSMTQSKMSRSTRPEHCAKCGAAQKIWSDTRRRNLEGGQKEENGPRWQQIEQTDPSRVTQTPFNPPSPNMMPAPAPSALFQKEKPEASMKSRGACKGAPLKENLWRPKQWV